MNLHKIACMETKTSHPEIDLLEVLAKIINQLRVNFVLTILLPVAGALGGFFLSQKATTSIRSEMMLSTDLLSEEQCIFLLGQFESARPIPYVSPQQQSEWVTFSHEIIRPYRYFSEDRTVNIKLSLALTNESSFDAYQESVITFLENSTAAVARKKSMQEFESKVIAGIDEELKAIDQIKADIARHGQSTSQNPAALYVESVKLLEKKLELQRQTQSGKVFTVIEGFKVRSSSTISRAKYIFAGFLAGVSALFLWIFIRYFARFYNRYQPDQS